MAQFEALGVLPELVRAVSSMNWLLPTAVQDEAIPLILGGGDVLIAAETGSGKTGAFCLPALQLIYEFLRGQAIVSAIQDKNENKLNDSNNNTSSFSFYMNPLDRDSICAVSSDGLKIQTRNLKDWAGIRCNVGIKSGCYCYEVRVTDEGLCRIGFSTINSVKNIGTDFYSFGYGGTAMKSTGGQFVSYGETFKLNDVITAYIDLNNFTLGFAKNGKYLGKAFDIPPALHGKCFYPAVTLKNAELQCNFTTNSFPLESSYQMISKAEFKQTSLSGDTESDSKNGGDTTSMKKKLQHWKPSDGPLAIIIEPTRELAQQVDAEITKFKAHLTDARIIHRCFTTGTDFKQMNDAVQKGAHIIISTPGKLIEFIKLDKIKLSSTRLFILDEADQLIDIGIRKDLLSMYSKMPRTDKQMQVIICSATLHSNEIHSLVDEMTVNPIWVDLKGKDSIPANVDHAVVLVDPHEDRTWQTGTHSQSVYCKTDGIHKNQNLRSDTAETYSLAIKMLKPLVLIQIIEEFKMDQCLIFARTQLDCDNLENYLLELGHKNNNNFNSSHTDKYTGKRESGKENLYSCTVLHSGRKPEERERNLAAFKEGDVRFLICTDVAARGIDIVGLPYVINYTLPDKEETYIHRVGRVGRAECIGLAISLVSTVQEQQWYHTCNNMRGKGCTNTKLTTEGGCCIWFNELEMLENIELKLGNTKVPHFDRHALYKGAEHLLKSAAAGRPKLDEIHTISEQHVNLLQPHTQKLNLLEIQAQQHYLQLKIKKWQQMLKE